MKLNKNKLKESVGDAYEDGRDRLHDMADLVDYHVRSDAKALARQARKQWKKGKRRYADVEETVSESVREHPAIFTLGVVCLVGLVAAFFLTCCRCDSCDSEKW